MPVHKLQSTDGFVVHDFADTPSSGLVRRGRKILQRSATDLARSATYAFAFHEIQRGGASAGLNAEGDDEGPALQALAAELSDELADGRLELYPAKGIGFDELSAAYITAVGDQPAAEATTWISADGLAESESLIAGVLSATSWALGSALEGRRLFIEGDPSDPDHQTLSAAATAAGAVLVEPNVTEGKPWTMWATEADALLVGSRPGAMNHQGAELVNVAAVVPWGPIPITTKALAVLLKRGITYVPDFVSATGTMFGHHLASGSGADSVATGVDSATSHALGSLDTTSDPLFIAACHRAESFLKTWQGKLPFGRPLAG